MPTTKNLKQKLSFYYGDERIDFACLPQKSHKKTLTIKITPNGQVIVFTPHLPTLQSDNDIIRLVKQRSRWIYKQLQGFRKQNEHQHTKQFISGETQYYLGKRYVLKIIISDNKQAVKLKNGQLQVPIVATDNKKHIEKRLNTWYRKRAEEVFNRRLMLLSDSIGWIDTPPAIKLLNMRTQWGSCSPSGNIVLNPHLVKAPRECIDYVIIHELCHLIEHNHSEKFYNLLSQIMPNWKTVKTRLDEKVELYL